MKRILNMKVKEMKAITLIALVITIVVLIILATVAIQLSLGNNGIFNRAKTATEDYKVRANEEQVELAKAGNIESTRDNTSIGPAGSVIAFMGDNEPEGYLKCEGQEVSRTTYSALFTAIGTKYGEGDGSTTFNVPDLRGEFLRGAGTNSHINQGNGEAVGEHQDGTEHPYVQADSTYTDQLTFNTNGHVNNDDFTKSSVTHAYYGKANTNGVGNSTYTSRPTNTSVLYCIKY